MRSVATCRDAITKGYVGVKKLNLQLGAKNLNLLIKANDLNELDEFRLRAFESSALYKEKT